MDNFSPFCLVEFLPGKVRHYTAYFIVCKKPGALQGERDKRDTGFWLCVKETTFESAISTEE
jgi:hypothetical protein